jgi:hypothetical protein
MRTNLSRFQAFVIHFLISAFILASFLSIVFFIWYPQPFFTVEGLIQIVWVLLGVDIILGPTLTLIIFKSGKPGLKRDLSIIAGIQIIFFIYGAHTIFIERPAFAVIYDTDYFDVLTVSDMKDTSKIDPALGYSRIGGPLFVYVDAPKDVDSLKKILEDMKKGGPYFTHRPEYYRGLKGYINKKFEFSKDMDELLKLPVDKTVINEFIAEYGNQVEDFAYFPISGKATSRLLVIDQKTELIVDYIDINPRAK